MKHGSLTPACQRRPFLSEELRVREMAQSWQCSHGAAAMKDAAMEDWGANDWEGFAGDGRSRGGGASSASGGASPAGKGKGCGGAPQAQGRRCQGGGGKEQGQAAGKGQAAGSPLLGGATGHEFLKGKGKKSSVDTRRSYGRHRGTRRLSRNRTGLVDSAARPRRSNLLCPTNWRWLGRTAGRIWATSS